MPPRSGNAPAMVAAGTPPRGSGPFNPPPRGGGGSSPYHQAPHISNPPRAPQSGATGGSTSGVFPASQPGRPAVTSGVPSPAPVSVRGGPGILLMTEDPNTVTTVTRVVTPINGDLITTRSPGEAFYALQSAMFERPYRARLVLIDALLPGVDGPTLVSMLRRDPRVAGATIVLLSSLSAQVVENMMRSWGADGYLLTNRGVIHVKTAIDGWLGLPKNSTRP